MLWNLVFFLLVLALAYAAARLLGRQSRHRPGGLLQLRDSLSLGRDRNLLLIEVGDRLLLVGSTPQAITLVSPLDGAIAPAPAAEPAAAEPAAAFAPLLARSLETMAAATGQRLYPAATRLVQRLRAVASALPGRLRATAAALSRPAAQPLQLQRARGALQKLAAHLEDSGDRS